MGRRTAVLVALAVAAALLPQTGSAQAVSDPDVSAAEAQTVATDGTAVLDDDGQLYYVDPAPEPPAGLPAPRRSQSTTTQQAGLAIPALHSRPVSTHVIFLDFDGTTLSASNAWVTSAVDPMSAGAKSGFTLDGSADFNAEEIAYIQKVWAIVAEKFTAYDVDVTTVDPGVAGYTRTSGADQTYGTHVVITDDPGPVTEICANQCAGVAYIDMFDARQEGQLFNNTDYEPAWVFSSQTFGSPQVTALDVAHETGHTFGLHHDGDSAHPDYYEGHANWVPIMGITNQNAVFQFNDGDYLDANQDEDDLAIIGGNGNAGTADSLLRPDDYTTSAGAPTGAAVLGSQASYAVDGVISTAADNDLFSISRTCTDALTATATGIGAGQSVDLKVEILDDANTVLASDDPGSGQTYVPASIAFEPTGVDATASLGATTAGSTYRIRVDGVGHGDPLAQTGYSDYGSIGQYHLTISACAEGNDPPTVPQNLTASPVQRSFNGSVSWTAPASAGDSPITGYTVTGLPGGAVTLGAGTTTAGSTSLVPGTTYPVSVVATNAYGDSPAAQVNLRISTWLPTAAPVVTPTVTGNDVGVTWGAVANPGKATITGWSTVLKRDGITVATATVPAANPRSRSYPDLQPGNYTFSVTVVGTADLTAGTTAGTTAFTIAAPPSAPVIGTPSSGITGGAITAVTRWAAPTSDGGSPITGYRVIAYKLTAAGNVAKGYYSPKLSAAVRSYKWTTLPAGRYKFKVVAYNAVGTSPRSAYSTIVVAR